MRLLLFSNSTNAGEEYLSYTLPYIKEFLSAEHKKAVFIPYAGVSIGWDDYSDKVKSELSKVNVEVLPIHKQENTKQAIEEAEVIIVGGGNTFNLLKTLQDKDLIPIIQKKVYSGTPYIGWSAGSNMACPTIRTTNDMPIVEPDSFEALGLIPFQINPHYIDEKFENHAGETREMRLAEFLIANAETYVAGLREGTALQVENDSIKLLGKKPCRILKYNTDPKELRSVDNFDFLMQ